ncbi:MAG: IS4 family transposase, partial [Candidatus Melainabacteria bacterium]
RIYHDYAQSLIQRARDLYINEKLDLELKNTVYAIDSSTIDLCLSIYEWAEFRSTKSGIKLHTVMDLKGSIPVLIDITEAIVSDNKFLEKIEIEKNAIYLMNRGYCDFERFNTINQNKAYFVTRLKRNIRFRRVYSAKVDKSTGLLFDQIGFLDSKLAKKKYFAKVRIIKYYDSEYKVTYVFLTNNFELDALTICKLYKQRWQIELFFKWIKQNLHIERFFGQSENAVKLQIWIAICAYLLIVILKKKMNIKTELSQILHFLSNVLFEQIPIQSLFSNFDYKTKEPDLCISALQLNLFAGH